MGYFADTPLARVNDAYKSQILNRITNSPGVKFIKENYPEIQQFLKDNSPVKVSYDDCNIIINDIFGTYSYRNPFCLPSPPLPPNVPYFADDFKGGFQQAESYCANGNKMYAAILSSQQVPYYGENGEILYKDYPGDTPLKEFASALITWGQSRLNKLRKEIIDSNGISGNNIYRKVKIVETISDWRTSNVSEYRFSIITKSPNGVIGGIVNGQEITILQRLVIRTLQGEKNGQTEVAGSYSFVETRFQDSPCLPPKYPPPPKPPDKKDKDCECMCCEGQQNNDALLKLVLKRIGSLPASVPDNFTKQHPSMISIESLAELMLWQMQQIDALLGAYPIELKIEDNDLTKEGNQEEKIALPNMAEAIAELLGLLITVKRDTHATLITAIKAMGEAGMAKNLGVKTLDVTLANAEYLGYKLEQKKKEVPSLFTPGGKDITETLIEKNVEIITYENTDKKDLQDDLKFLKTMAARWNAQNWRQVTGDPVESLKQTLFGNPEAIGEVHKKNEQGDFNGFTEQAERGFIEVSGITDSINPWGRPYSQRPKIREIGTEKGNYGNDGKETAS
ncbi:hypothetical protein [Nostoc sp.]|uniref:hypothetical protein n=1 Tax=Nostoc sp. TaxID=1180 RepID=UPI002FFC1456